MKRIICLLALFSFVNFQLSIIYAQYVPTAENLKARSEFQDKKLGIFLHWGVYAMMGQREWGMNNRNID